MWNAGVAFEIFNSSSCTGRYVDHYVSIYFAYWMMFKYVDEQPQLSIL